MKTISIILAVIAVYAIYEAEGNICTSAGQFQDISDCSSYNLCFQNPISGKMESMHITCGKGKAYDPVHRYCSKDAYEKCRT